MMKSWQFYAKTILFFCGAIILIFFIKMRLFPRRIIYDALENIEFNQGSAVIRFNDFTDFEWERAVFFLPPTTTSELSDTLGFDYKQVIDLETKIVFVENGEVVCEERIKNDYESFPKVFIYNDDIETGNNIVVLLPNELYSCTKNEYGIRPGGNYYRITPLE